MRNIIFTVGTCFMLMLFASCEKEELIDADSLPTPSISFLEQHFANVNISVVKKEREGIKGVEFTVYLQNGTKVTFDKGGQWEDAEAAEGQSLPSSFIPSAIVKYVQTNYDSQGINSIDRERNRYDVELTSGLELVFNSQGEFIKID